jgi:hypothetical protein
VIGLICTNHFMLRLKKILKTNCQLKRNFSKTLTTCNIEKPIPEKQENSEIKIKPKKKNKYDFGDESDEDHWDKADAEMKKKISNLAAKALGIATLINICIAILFVLWVRYYLNYKTIPEFKSEYLQPRITRIREKFGIQEVHDKVYDSLNSISNSKPEVDQLTMEEKQLKMQNFKKLIEKSKDEQNK